VAPVILGKLFSSNSMDK